MSLLFGRTSVADVVPVRTDADGRLEVGNHGYINGSFYKNPLAFGLSGVVRGVVSNTSLGAGANNLDGGAVPAGEFWVITNIKILYVGTVATVQLSVGIYSSGTNFGLYDLLTPVSGLSYDRQGWWPMTEGEFLRYRVVNATLNDDAYLHYSGFRVDIDL